MDANLGYIYIYHMILDALPSNIEYTARWKAMLNEAYAESNIAFLSPAHSTLDGEAYNILYIIHCIDDIKPY